MSKDTPAKKYGSKILISGMAMSGKTTLLETLNDVFIVARDGKRYPFSQPHTNMPDIVHSKNDLSAAEGIINVINTKLGLYKGKFGKLPATLVFDSISKIFLDIEAAVASVVTSFPYGVINIEIAKLMAYIENTLIPNGINVVYVSHALIDEDTASYKLVNAGGAYGKKGGVLSETDESIFLESKSNKRVIHFKSLKFISRTLNKDLPDSVQAADFNLQTHLDVLSGKTSGAADFEM